MPTRPIRRALISVSDKTGIEDFARFLNEQGVEILSTGGTAKMLRDVGIAVKDVSDHTGFPEIMDGRVKTLHPLIHGGLLAVRDNAEHESAMAAEKITPIDLLVVNLYPFEETVKSGADFDTCIENIDVGGPAMIRGAAKNHAFVTVVVKPEDYEEVMDEMRAMKGGTTPELRKRLAATAFLRTGSYDTAISSWMNQELGRTFPRSICFSGRLKQVLRYGENPHQLAALYESTAPNITACPGVTCADQLQGKELSYNNLNDTDAAFELVAEFSDTACAIIKHANPSGVAVAGSLREAYNRALACDPESAFGGVIAVNRELDAKTAEDIVKIFTEVVIAPSVSADAQKILATKQNIRVLISGVMPDPNEEGMKVRTLAGGLLLQTRDVGIYDNLDVVTKRAPTDKELEDLKFAFTVAKHVKSNAIVYARDLMTVGVGAGQMSRVNSCRIAAWKAADAAKKMGEGESLAKGSVVASDAFFPFADGLLEAIEAGATAVIQPGGSMRDDEVIAAADEAGIAMVMTGMRHFNH